MSSSSSETAEAHRGAAEDAWKVLYQLFFDGIGQRRFHEACSATGLAPGVMKALLQLRPGQPLPMRDLAEIFSCDPSYITSLVDGLEEAGLAERQLHPTDRRIRVVVVTDRGLHTQDAIRKILGEPPDAFLALSSNELRQLRRLLDKVVAQHQGQSPPAQ